MSLALLVSTGCQSNAPTTSSAVPVAAVTAAEVLRISEGDTVMVSFPGAPEMNTIQKVRTDGRITLALIGEISVAGLTPEELKVVLLKRYDTQLVAKEITVSVAADTVAYVTGAVLRPGKVVSERPITLLQALMEAGGPDLTRADLSRVRVIRESGGQVQNFNVDLKQVFDGKSTDSFTLKTGDTVVVPERFTWF